MFSTHNMSKRCRFNVTFARGDCRKLSEDSNTAADSRAASIGPESGGGSWYRKEDNSDVDGIAGAVNCSELEMAEESILEDDFRAI